MGIWPLTAYCQFVNVIKKVLGLDSGKLLVTYSRHTRFVACNYIKIYNIIRTSNMHLFCLLYCIKF